LSAKDDFQKRPRIADKKKPGKFTNNLAVSIEHVLEWNTFLQFIGCNTSPKRCEHLAKWFGEKINVETTMPVQKWNINGTDDKGPTKATFREKAVKAIDWITMVYPGTQNGYVHEFVSLHDDVNTRKEKVRPTLSSSPYYK
jgi:hypothetical protein